MFDWFGRTFRRREYLTWADIPPADDMTKVAGDMNKVLPFPELKAVPLPPVQEPTGKTVYSVGLTDDNRVSLIVGYGSILMNPAGVQQLIDQLTLFKNQIEKTESE